MKTKGPFVDLCRRLESELGVDSALRVARLLCEAAGRERLYVHNSPPEELIGAALRQAVTQGTSVARAAEVYGVSRRTAFRYQRRWSTEG